MKESIRLANTTAQENPLHRECSHCGHKDDIEAAVGMSDGQGNTTYIFGSAADFCTKCDKPWN